jgi:hypothetical protein
MSNTPALQEAEASRRKAKAILSTSCRLLRGHQFIPHLPLYTTEAYLLKMTARCKFPKPVRRQMLSLAPLWDAVEILDWVRLNFQAAMPDEVKLFESAIAALD